ncbi:MAG: protein-L-isoaspartate(D-aspartate) O-methyltransferase [Candidatus Marsarchaeota archaeon]|jgi:protein-L-isoaspartate(D-aspartate) O-methyltransferase|nr:protein-L-isoaspartate(D-aspartate) O-methyltransferase [Candidatus Marsarchaeota archaeon]
MDDQTELNDAFVDVLVHSGILRSKRIIDAFKHIKRHLFVRKEDMEFAYQDMPLPLARDSTISQPSTVAVMLEYLDIREGDRVLEIGTGSGWNAALIGYCVGSAGSVVSLEIDNELANNAKDNISKTEIKNVKIICKDGTKGHIEDAPYDRIIYTASVKKIPGEVLSQLKVGGILLAPVGDEWIQVLTSMKKIDENSFDEVHLGYFQFVPLRGIGG